MNIQKYILIILLCILVVSFFSYTSCSNVDKPLINRDVAIMIAAANVPSSIAEEVSVFTLWDDNKWTVHFFLPQINRTVTKDELGWFESPSNKFKNQGLLPADTYRLFTFHIDRSTGVVISRQASDSILLGGPGIFDTEPLEMSESVSLPLWTTIASGIGGLVVGGIIIYLIMLRKNNT